MRKTKFTIITKNKKLEDMMITSIRFARNQGDGKKLKFSATAKQVRIVKSSTVQIKNIAKSAAGSGSAKQKLGTQPTQTPTTETNKNASLLFRGMKFVTGG